MNMLDLLIKLVIPLTLLYFGPFVFGLYYINKQIKILKIKEATIWIVFLFMAPIFAILIFYFAMVKNKRIVLENT